MADSEDHLGRPMRGVVEVEWDGWDDAGTRSRAPWVVAVLLLLAVGVVAALVVWAVGNGDAELPPDTTTTEVAPG